MSSGQGAIPDRRYSPRARERRTWCNSKTDSRVWMKEDVRSGCALFCAHPKMHTRKTELRFRVCIFLRRWEHDPKDEANHNGRHALRHGVRAGGAGAHSPGALSGVRTQGRRHRDRGACLRAVHVLPGGGHCGAAGDGDDQRGRHPGLRHERALELLVCMHGGLYLWAAPHARRRGVGAVVRLGADGRGHAAVELFDRAPVHGAAAGGGRRAAAAGVPALQPRQGWAERGPCPAPVQARGHGPKAGALGGTVGCGSGRPGARGHRPPGPGGAGDVSPARPGPARRDRTNKRRPEAEAPAGACLPEKKIRPRGRAGSGRRGRARRA